MTAYDRASAVGHLARGVDDAPSRGWTVFGMKSDWTTVDPTRRS